MNPLDNPPWYRRGPIWLLPEWGFRPADEQNCCDWWFNWLTLSIWSAMSPAISVSVSLEFEMSPHIQINALYHHIRLSLPMPGYFAAWSYRYLWRVPKRDK